MMIDTQRLRGGIQAQVDKEVADLDDFYPPPHKLPLKNPEREQQAIAAYIRVEELQQATEELIAAVEALAREYIHEVTP